MSTRTAGAPTPGAPFSRYVYAVRPQPRTSARDHEPGSPNEARPPLVRREVSGLGPHRLPEAVGGRREGESEGRTAE
ncbi:hypothetical protein ACFVT1_15225 [Streptomyces sp. NPDC057963]|uniref:hypothetical protein n=1 Tax=Streptomyces sp. NPDC057963 TaxID=3346290 RepID=UPI0036EA3865